MLGLRRRARRCTLLSLVLSAACAVQPVDLGRPVRFPGATAISDSVLRQLVADAATPGPVDKERVTAAAEAVRLAYIRRGYADVAVTHSELPDGTLQFAVQEGRHWRLAALDVEGNAAITKATLIGLWRYVPGPYGRMLEVPAFAPGEDFDTEHLDRWATLVLARYIDTGYLDARLDVPLLTRDEPASTVSIVLRVAHEGPRYKIRDFEVSDAVRALLGDDMPAIPAGEFCTRERAEGFAAAVLNGLRRRGHVEPELKVSATRDAEAGEVSLRLAVAAGPARDVVEIAVVGSKRVPAALVRDKLGLQIGARFDGDIERRGIATLSATGEFSQLDVRYEPLDDQRLRVVVDTVETTGLVLRGAPYLHPWRRFGYNFLIEGRDALGERHDLLGHVHVGHRGYHFGGRYLRSGIFDDQTSLSVGGDFYYNERPAFTDRGVGGNVELRRYFSPGLSVATSYALLEHFDTTFDSTSTTRIGRDYTEGRVSLSIDFDQTDNRLLPTRGEKAYVKLARVDEALGADVEFTRLQVGAGLWLPCSKRVRWSLEAETGLLWPDGDAGGSLGIPVPERFFTGGYDSVRSFRESRLGARDATGALRGGEFHNFARTELVFRTVEPLDVALFADAGNLGVDASAWDLNDMRYALGLALRLMSSDTGPVVVSAAWNPDRVRGEDEWVVDFAAGVMF